MDILKEPLNSKQHILVTGHLGILTPKLLNLGGFWNTVEPEHYFVGKQNVDLSVFLSHYVTYNVNFTKIK